jgi:uncharacterized membrane-anchored protein YjiN (DUF445 family)
MSEERQFTQLNRMRRIATGLLVLMTFLFIGAKLLQPQYAYLSFVVAFAEAAMVGALADWFAVTALFRRPLGLPIPHTAIIPENKDRIGESLADFLQHNFMTREVLNEELAQMDFAGVGASWLAQADSSRAVATHLVSAIPAVLHMMEDDDVGRFLQTATANSLQGTKFAPLLGEILSVLVAGGHHQVVFDRLIVLAGQALEQNHEYIRQKIHETSPRWMPKVLDEKFFERLIEGIQSILEEMQHMDSEWRGRFHDATAALIDNLRTSPEYEEKVSHVIAQSLTHPLFRNYIVHVWREIKQRLLADAASADSQAVARLADAIRIFSETLIRDDTARVKLNQWMRGFAIDVISGWREVIADLIKRVILKWDAGTVARKFEQHVGKDLQYIRINGTLVGGMVGLLLHALTLAFL